MSLRKRIMVTEPKRCGTAVPLLLMLLVFAIPLEAHSQESVKPKTADSGAGVWLDIAPLVELTTRPALASGAPVPASYLEWFYSRPAFLTAGFSLKRGPLSAVMSVELQQDVGELYLGGSLVNLPINHDYTTFFFSNNYPNVGFVEGLGNGWRFSAGRRSLNIGAGTYSLTVSGANPWYDHVLAELEAPLGAGSLRYDFLAISTQRRSGNDGKSLFLHQIGFDFPVWSASLAEFNTVAGVPLDLQDIGPFLIYHHLFASGSNVMFKLDGQLKPSERLRAWGGILMDDFQLSSESTASNPNAFGFEAGVEAVLIPGHSSERARFYRKDYTVSLGPEQLDGRLKASLQWYWASTYLYRRVASAPNEAFYTRYFLQNQNFGWAVVEPWFSYPLGPDRMLFRADLRYSKERLSLKATGTFAMLGSESDEYTYNSPYASSWLGPQPPLSYSLKAELAAEMTLGRQSLVSGSLYMIWNTGEPTEVGLQLGFIHRFSLPR